MATAPLAKFRIGAYGQLVGKGVVFSHHVAGGAKLGWSPFTIAANRPAGGALIPDLECTFPLNEFDLVAFVAHGNKVGVQLPTPVVSVLAELELERKSATKATLELTLDGPKWKEDVSPAVYYCAKATAAGQAGFVAVGELKLSDVGLMWDNDREILEISGAVALGGAIDLAVPKALIELFQLKGEINFNGYGKIDLHISEFARMIKTRELRVGGAKRTKGSKGRSGRRQRS